MALVGAEHLALAAYGLCAVLAVVIDLHLVGFADFLLYFLVDQLVHDIHQLVDEPVAAGHRRHPLDLLPAVRALGLQEQAAPDAPLAVKLRAEGAHHGAVGVAEADMAGQQLLQLVPRVLGRVLDMGFGGCGCSSLLIGLLVDA